MRMVINDLSSNLTIEKAMSAPKVFQLKKSVGMPMLIKLVCMILKSFCDSIKASKTMDSVDILECAELLIETYTHDSVKDFILALKEAKKKGMTFYNTISTPVIFEIITEYMDKKSAFIEKEQADNKSKYDGSVRAESASRLAGLEREREQRERELKEVRSIRSEKKELQTASEIIKKSLES